MEARIVLAFLLFAPVVAWAQQQPVVTAETLCREIVAHHPEDGVEYIPGKDVYWRDVAPADVNGGEGQIRLNDTIRVGIGMYQAQQLNLPATTPYSPELFLGDVELTKDGGVYFNGKRLTQPQVQTLCDERYQNDPLNSSGQK